jgi:hypothetical protein
MLFLNENSNKKEYFIQKIQITPKWLETGIHKNEVFDIFVLLILKNCSGRMKHK